MKAYNKQNLILLLYRFWIWIQLYMPRHTYSSTMNVTESALSPDMHKRPICMLWYLMFLLEFLTYYYRRQGQNGVGTKN